MMQLTYQHLQCTVITAEKISSPDPDAIGLALCSYALCGDVTLLGKYESQTCGVTKG